MRFATYAACLLLVAGCGDKMDQQSATKVMSSALTGTGAAQAQLKPAAGQTSASFDGVVQNPAGTGSAHVVGSAQQTGNGWVQSFDITFTKWHDLASDVTLDGTLHETATFTTTAPFVGDVKISGVVAATGAVQASADFDLAVSYSPTKYQVIGHVGGASLEATVGL